MPPCLFQRFQTHKLTGSMEYTPPTCQYRQKIDHKRTLLGDNGQGREFYFAIMSKGENFLTNVRCLTSLIAFCPGNAQNPPTLTAKNCDYANRDAFHYSGWQNISQGINMATSTKCVGRKDEAGGMKTMQISRPTWPLGNHKTLLYFIADKLLTKFGKDRMKTI
ncbi:hypothetical protein DPMN_039908 [Dreissena polymorpha]|uniref:Uncharacterized protein n=1 Tax=Dreissena polymorpha TaxID=45954 RepID=A0A9D4HSK1_DREPO|nr:hypothetical protein DPMN_039908 [Dreissena polymorpha]